MPRPKSIIEVHGVLGTISEHIDRTGFERSTVYGIAKRHGITVEQYLNSLPESAFCVEPHEKKEAGDPFEKGYPWDIRGCENIINAVVCCEFRDLVDSIAYYTQFPTERNRKAVAYFEGWINDAIPNYYDISPDVIIKEAWKKGRAEGEKRKRLESKEKGQLHPLSRVGR